jgi:DNA-binding transcriptional LysR family regulator
MAGPTVADRTMLANSLYFIIYSDPHSKGQACGPDRESHGDIENCNAPPAGNGGLRVNLRHLSYLLALSREKHFHRAAAACNITQPTLSQAIKQLEAEMRVPLIERNNHRILGFTPEGARMIDWAQRILADFEALAQEFAAPRKGLSGRLRLGVIPAAMPAVSLVTTPFTMRHPGVTVTVLSCSSTEIQQGIASFELDAGLTYLDNEPLNNVTTLPLYDERYVLLTPQNGPFAGRSSVKWAEAAALPLCLFTANMQNRRIVNRNFANAGIEPRAVIETDSITGLCAHVRSGHWSSIVPHIFLSLFGELHGAHALPLTEPSASQSVGLVLSAHEPLSPLARALAAVSQPSDLAHQIEQMAEEFSPVFRSAAQ